MTPSRLAEWARRALEETLSAMGVPLYGSPEAKAQRAAAQAVLEREARAFLEEADNRHEPLVYWLDDQAAAAAPAREVCAEWCGSRWKDVPLDKRENPQWYWSATTPPHPLYTCSAACADNRGPLHPPETAKPCATCGGEETVGGGGDPMAPCPTCTSPETGGKTP